MPKRFKIQQTVSVFCPYRSNRFVSHGTNDFKKTVPTLSYPQSNKNPLAISRSSHSVRYLTLLNQKGLKVITAEFFSNPYRPPKLSEKVLFYYDNVYYVFLGRLFLSKAFLTLWFYFYFRVLIRSFCCLVLYICSEMFW